MGKVPRSKVGDQDYSGSVKEVLLGNRLLSLGSFPPPVTVTTMGFRIYKLDKAPLRKVTGKGKDPSCHQEAFTPKGAPTKTTATLKVRLYGVFPKLGVPFWGSP